jgi:ureidoglycolate lyase
MTRVLQVKPLTAQAFQPWGDVIEPGGAPDKIINDGRCGRFHDRARLDFGDGRAGISLFDAEIRTLPLEIPLVERHPLGSQAFMPVSGARMLVVVADYDGGKPLTPNVFLSAPGQSVNLLRGVWHGVLTPVGTDGATGQFVVVDRIGGGDNLEEHHFDQPWRVETLPGGVTP